MSYFHIAEENLPLAGFGCGPDCQCAACRSAGLGFGERYIKAEVDREPLRPPPASTPALPSVPSEAEQTAGWFGGAPQNRLWFPSSLRLGHPLAEAKTRVRYFTCTAADQAKIEAALKMSILPGALRQAVETAAGNAVSWLWNAGAALRTSPRAARAKTLFCEAFGTTPEFVPGWRAANAKWIDRGDLVAIRLYAAAKILDGGWIRYYCWGSPSYCPECKRQPPTYFACSSWGKKYVICLGEAFWKAWQARDEATLASTLLHEALHIYFGTLIAEDEKGRYGNANCYERYVIRFNNKFLHSATDAACARFATPC